VEVQKRIFFVKLQKIRGISPPGRAGGGGGEKGAIFRYRKSGGLDRDQAKTVSVQVFGSSIKLIYSTSTGTVLYCVQV
jgi:hypothetical protein